MGLVARAEGTFYGSPMGRGSDRTTMAVVAEINDDADRFLRSVVSVRPLSRSVMQAAANFGTIPLRHLAMMDHAVAPECGQPYRPSRCAKPGQDL